MRGNIRNRLQTNRLHKMGLVIESHFKNEKKQTFMATSDGTRADPISDCRLTAKVYKRGKEVLHKETKFQNTSYRLIMEKQKIMTCPNCGNVDHVQGFVDGCQYCGTKFNVKYASKQTGNKQLLFNLPLTNAQIRTVRVVLFLVLLIWVYMRQILGGEFNVFTAVLGVLQAGIYFVAVQMAVGILSLLYISIFFINVRRFNRFLWEANAKEGLSFSYPQFLTSANDAILQTELQGEESVMDVDVLSYEDIHLAHVSDRLYVSLKAKIRIVSYRNEAIQTRIQTKTYIFFYTSVGAKELAQLYTIIPCRGCGQTIELSEGTSCTYCGREAEYMETWKIVPKAQ